MTIVSVSLPDHAYEIRIGDGVLSELGAHIKPLLARDFVAVVTDENVAELYQDQVEKALASHGIQSVFITVPAGEASKSWPVLTDVVEALLEARIERDDLVIALGGGVVGDLTGFAASILRRGVRFVQVPTSLLAQVDSSVGGKTGINSPHGKNLIGAFHQPELVICDTGVLSTLPKREFLAGYGEVLKYGLLGDAGFVDWLEANGNRILALEPDALGEMVRHSCQMKADIVARDEKERGDRALLNLGHTFGHALERVTGYSDRLLHGEGVAIGMVLAFMLSRALGYTDEASIARVRAHLAQMGMKSSLSDIDGEIFTIDELIEAMYQDKKVRAGSLTFILVRAIGEAFIESDIDEAVVRQVLKEAGL